MICDNIHVPTNRGFKIFEDILIILLQSKSDKIIFKMYAYT